MATRLLHDTIHGGQAEAGALSLRFGREERLEDPLLGLGVHSRPRVAHREEHITPRRDARMRRGVGCVEKSLVGLDTEHSAVRHRVPGVHGQIEQHLFHLRRVSPERGQAFERPRLDANAGIDQPAQHLLHPGDDLVQTDESRLEDLLAAEGEQLIRERGSANRGIINFVDVGAADVSFGNALLE